MNDEKLRGSLLTFLMADRKPKIMEKTEKKFRHITREQAEGLSDVVRGGRGFEEYAEGLNLEGVNLENKTILDIGGGKGKFVREVKEKFNGVKVFNLDPYPVAEKITKQVAGIAEQLPFKENTFDLAVSFYATPLYIESGAGEVEFFEEIFRVLKPGGEARIAPFSLTFHERALKQVEKIIKNKFKDSMLKIELEHSGVLFNILVLKKLPPDT